VREIDVPALHLRAHRLRSGDLAAVGHHGHQPGQFVESPRGRWPCPQPASGARAATSL
jgi:hypothetical protein